MPKQTQEQLRKKLRKVHEREKEFLNKHLTPKELSDHISKPSLPWDVIKMLA